MNKKHSRFKWTKRVGGGLGLALLILGGPIGYNYAKYFWPTTALPMARLDEVDAVAADSFDPASTGSAVQAARVYMRDASIPGLSATISRGDQILLTLTLGYADLDTDASVTPKHRFRLGSTTKAITGALVGRLFDQGRIEIDRPIGEFMSGLPEHLQVLTIRQLASHTAGVRHYNTTDINPYTGEMWTLEENGLAIFKNDPLLFEPGAGFSYSTYGFTLLGEALAAATGKGILDLLEAEIFAPAQMAATVPDYHGRSLQDRTGHYTTGDGKYTGALPQAVSYKWAAGGILSTPGDMVRFGQALLADRLMSVATRELIWTTTLLADGSDAPQGYALGWRRVESRLLLGEDRPTLIIHHGGRQAGASSFFAILPEHGIVVSVLANSGSGEVRGAVQNLAIDLMRLAIDGPEAALLSD